MSGGHPFMSPKRFVKELGIKAIDAPDGSRLEPLLGGISVGSPDIGDGFMTVTVRYAWFAPKPMPAELEQATRDVVVITQKLVAVPVDPELSDWIDGSVKPTIVGVYERDFPHSISCPQPNYSYWDGVSWHHESNDVRKALYRRALSFCQNASWRGLRHDPALSEGHAS